MRTFLFNYLLYKERGHGEKVDFVGNSFGSLDGSDVGIDQDGFNSLFTESFEGLGSGLVEFSRLADLKGSGA